MFANSLLINCTFIALKKSNGTPICTLLIEKVIFLHEADVELNLVSNFEDTFHPAERPQSDTVMKTVGTLHRIHSKNKHKK